MYRILITTLLLFLIGCQQDVVVIPSQLSQQDKGLERPVPPVQAPIKNRVALVIGNANYKFAPLNNPVNDARDMAKSLRSVGFDVIKKEDASWEDMDKAITAFQKKLGKGVVGLFYFSGHGIQIDEQNYLIPVDLPELSVRHVKYRSILAGDVLTELMFKKVRNTVKKKTNNRQTPWESSSLDGDDFYFVKKKTVVASTSDTPPVVPVVPVNTGQSAEIASFKREKAEAEAEAKAERECQARIKAEKLRKKTSKVFRDTLSIGGKGPEMVRIPAGSFRMGDIQGGGQDDEKPVHQVSVGAFAMGKYEVTFAEYDKFANATGKSKPRDSGWGRGNRPVINVSWNDSVAYTKWLSQQTGHTYRLPTEAEWEYAARAGTSTKYWWGNNIGTNKANCDGCGSRWDYKQTAPVGSFAANPFGLHDTVGNVREWTCSEYESKYQGNDKVCKKRANLFVLRGGSWYNDPWWARSAFRIWNWPSNRIRNNGFRLSRTK